MKQVEWQIVTINYKEYIHIYKQSQRITKINFVTTTLKYNTMIYYGSYYVLLLFFSNFNVPIELVYFKINYLCYASLDSFWFIYFKPVVVIRYCFIGFVFFFSWRVRQSWPLVFGWQWTRILLLDSVRSFLATNCR